jgi:hypothetical protein
VKANTMQPTNDAIKCINWTTLSPIPSSSFVRSLGERKQKPYEKHNTVFHTHSFDYTTIEDTTYTGWSCKNSHLQFFTPVEHNERLFCAK